MLEAKRRHMGTAKEFGTAYLPKLSTGIPLTDLSSPDEITMAGIRLVQPGIGTLLRGMLTDLSLRVHDKYGDAAFACTKQAAAIHEAGHAVVYAAHGAPLVSCYIKPTGTGWIGYTEAANVEFHVKDGHGETVERFLHRARYLMAGVMAERLFDPDYRPGSSLDEVVMALVMSSKAARLAGVSTSKADDEQYFEEEVRRVVAAMLLRHQQVGKQIARYLFDHRRIAGDLVKRWTGRIAA